MKAHFRYSPRACVFKKSYGDIHVTTVLELPNSNIKKDGRKKAVDVLKDDIYNLLNDTELESLLMPNEMRRNHLC